MENQITLFLGLESCWVHTFYSYVFLDLNAMENMQLKLLITIYLEIRYHICDMDIPKSIPI